MDGDGLAVEVELQSQKPGNKTKLMLEPWTKTLTLPRQVKKLLLYIFVHPGFYMDRLVGHHEAFADVGLGPGAHLAGGVLDFTDDEASGVPASKQMNKNKETTESRRQEVPSAMPPHFFSIFSSGLHLSMAR